MNESDSVAARMRDFDARMAATRAQMARHHADEAEAEADRLAKAATLGPIHVPDTTNHFGLLLDELRAERGRRMAKADAGNGWIREAFARPHEPERPGADFGPLLKSLRAMNAEMAADLRKQRRVEFQRKFAEADTALRKGIASGKISSIEAAKAEAAMARMAAAMER